MVNFEGKRWGVIEEFRLKMKNPDQLSLTGILL